MQVNIERLCKDVDMVCYAQQGDAGFDLRSSENVVLAPGEKKIVKTGIKIAIPEKHVGLIWDRSGMAAKHEIHALAGVVDSGYRGEVGVVLKNLSNKEFQIEKNMRIAQMLIQPVVSAMIEEVESLEETERGDGGFGSTGMQ